MTAIPDPDAERTAEAPEPPKKRSALREGAILVGIAVVLYYVMLTFIARPYLIPSESMEPTLHGCKGCVGDRIMVDKLSYRFGSPQPGDVIVFKGPPNWNVSYKSIRSHNPAPAMRRKLGSPLGDPALLCVLKENGRHRHSTVWLRTNPLACIQAHFSPDKNAVCLQFQSSDSWISQHDYVDTPHRRCACLRWFRIFWKRQSALRRPGQQRTA